MMPTRAQELAFLRSVTYASLFDYPLTLAQLHASLVEVRAEAPSVESWWRDSAFLQATVEYRDGLLLPCRTQRPLTHQDAPRSVEPRSARARTSHPVARRAHAVRAHGGAYPAASRTSTPNDPRILIYS